MKNIYGFEKSHSNKALTVIEIIVIALLSILIIAILAFNFLFKKDGVAPDLFGYKIYLSRASTMGEMIPNNSAVFAKSDVSDLQRGNVVLADIKVEQDTYTTILRIMDMKEQDGTTYYLLKGDASPDTETFLVPESAIVARAMKYSEFFGKFLVFSTSQVGILLVIIIPCVIIILVQVFRIIRVNRMEEDEEFENIDFDEEDEVVFSTRRAGIGVDEEEPPARKVYVTDSGKADFQKSPPPTADIRDFDRSVKESYNPIKTIPSAPSRSTIAKKNSIAANFSQKPIAPKRPEAASDFAPRVKVAPEPEHRYDSDFTSIYERPIQRPKPQPEIPLEPPVVENPVDITIPTEAVKPKETIAPPPKKSNNKTLEELMRVIDNAQASAGKHPRV